MKKVLFSFILTITFSINNTNAQCSMCTKTAEQSGEKTGKGLNNAIIYLAAIPFAIAGAIGYRWWKSNK